MHSSLLFSYPLKCYKLIQHFRSFIIMQRLYFPIWFLLLLFLTSFGLKWASGYNACLLNLIQNLWLLSPCHFDINILFFFCCLWYFQLPPFCVALVKSLPAILSLIPFFVRWATFALLSRTSWRDVAPVGVGLVKGYCTLHREYPSFNYKVGFYHVFWWIARPVCR